MPKCLLVYFSVSGSTARVAEHIASGLRESGYQVDLHNLRRSPNPPPLDDYELLGVGSPVYYYRLPFNVSDYIRQLKLDGLPYFAFVLWATARCDAGEQLRRALAGQGGRDAGYFHSKGAGHFFPYIKEGYRFSVEHPTAEDLARAEAFARDIALRISEGKSPEVLPEPRTPPIYGLERLLSGRLFVRHLYSRLFRVDSKKCNGCGLCVRTCPTKNIVLNSQGLPSRGRDCLVCLVCESRCPQDAVTSPMSWPIFRPFVIYNVHLASRDPQLTYVHVTHHHGRTRILRKDRGEPPGADGSPGLS